jgi:hypothetical protein
MQPGTAAIWGNTSTGMTYFLFYDGGNYLGFPLQAI